MANVHGVHPVGRRGEARAAVSIALDFFVGKVDVDRGEQRVGYRLAAE